VSLKDEWWRIPFFKRIALEKARQRESGCRSIHLLQGDCPGQSPPVRASLQNHPCDAASGTAWWRITFSKGFIPQNTEAIFKGIRGSRSRLVKRLFQGIRRVRRIRQKPRSEVQLSKLADGRCEHRGVITCAGREGTPAT
jgi:hypothetical protein